VLTTFRILHVFVVMEDLNVRAHPTAAWTLQQLREAILILLANQEL
jgi:hypothetical protein